MNFELIILFFILSVINVFLQTAKTLIMIKTDNKHIIGLVQAIVYGFYTVILVYTNCELSLLWKILICALANFIGSELTYIAVNPILKKIQKDKLWKIEATISNQGIEPEYDDCIIELKNSDIPFNYIDIKKYIIINCFCSTQKESQIVKKILKKYDAKFSAYESKTM